jgi:hypothetical protein
MGRRQLLRRQGGRVGRTCLDGVFEELRDGLSSTSSGAWRTIIEDLRIHRAGAR